MKSYLESHQICYYISLSAPPIRRPIVGNEAYIRPEIGFNPSWFHKFCDIDFSEKWHKNPELRLATFEKMQAEIKRHFPGRNIGGILDGQPPDLLTGVYGASVFPAVFGLDLEYYSDKWPAHRGQHLSNQEAADLQPVDWDNNPIFMDILNQMDIIERLTGSVRGFLNWQGVLNMAFRLRGQQIFLDILENQELAKHIFDVIAESIIRGIKAIYRRQEASGINYKFASVGNCVVNMISPDQYRDFIFPRDLKIRSEFEHFGVHNCAWNVDPYIEAYATIPDLGYIDMGQVSNLSKIRELLPRTRRNVLYTSMDIEKKTKQEIKQDFDRVAAELAPCDIGLPDMESNIPDDKINFVFDLCEKLSEKYSQGKM